VSNLERRCSSLKEGTLVSLHKSSTGIVKKASYFSKKTGGDDGALKKEWGKACSRFGCGGAIKRLRRENSGRAELQGTFYRKDHATNRIRGEIAKRSTEFPRTFGRSLKSQGSEVQLSLGASGDCRVRTPLVLVNYGEGGKVARRTKEFALGGGVRRQAPASRRHSHSSREGQPWGERPPGKFWNATRLGGKDGECTNGTLY